GAGSPAAPPAARLVPARGGPPAPGGDPGAAGPERPRPARAAVAVPQGEQVGVVQPAEVVPLPAAAVLLVGRRHALLQAVPRAGYVVDAVLQLALGDAAVVEGGAGLLALGHGHVARRLGLL